MYVVYICFVNIYYYSIFSLKLMNNFKMFTLNLFRAVINYVRAVPSIDDFETIGHDVFGSEQDPRIKSLREAVQYFRKGTQDGYSKQKPKVAKKGKNIPFEEQDGATEGQKNNETKNECNKESDLVERIALDLDQLDINETVAKVKEQIDLESITVESNIVEAIGKKNALKVKINDMFALNSSLYFRKYQILTQLCNFMKFLYITLFKINFYLLLCRYKLQLLKQKFREIAQL